ncbi:MAG TPA: methionine--tRNA ligase [bacterium]
MKTTYVTTPLYYVNASPHIGHSYTNIAADCYARYRRLRGEQVFFLTGTDEHGQKIAQAALASGKTPQQFADDVVVHFQSLWERLRISHDDFIRTTQPRHEEAVKRIVAAWERAGKLRKSSYQGWYCTPDETFWTDAELAELGRPVCPACQRPLERTQEEGWYLELEAHRGWLAGHVKAHPEFVRPESRRNELMGLLEAPLPEHLCITRPKTRLTWGIEAPFSPDHVIYVWIDALLNYITVPGYPADADRFSGIWPADIHFIGKDILRHHALYWPIMLHALGFTDEQMPRTIFAHGWWRIGEQKMSKSLGNIIDPSAVLTHVLAAQPHAADVYRYFLLREVPFGQDGGFSEDALRVRLNADLGNDLGNLVHRTLSMIERYEGGAIPAGDGLGSEDRALREAVQALPGTLDAAMADVQFSSALEAIMRVISQANQYIESQAPWTLAKQGDSRRLRAVLRTLAETIRAASILLEPFMPGVAAAIRAQLGLGEAPRLLADAAAWPGLADGQRLGPKAVLFPKGTS